MIRFTKVSKQYARGGPALEEVSFNLRRGEFAFLTGPSGAGKSTILKLVYVAERPTSGEVRVDGKSSVTMTPREIPLLRRRLGVVFQDFRLLDDRTAEQNVAFALEVTGASESQIAPKVARALVNDPLVLLADEPTGNLDERSTRGVFQLLKDINASGTAVLMATHDLTLVRETQYRTLEMNRGRLVFDSAADDPGALG